MKFQSFEYRWLKAQKKYRNLQRRILFAKDEGLVKRLLAKLEGVKSRLLGMNKRWKLGVATSFLLAWMAASPAQAQFTSPLELSSLDGNIGFTINGIDDEDDLGVSVSRAGDINGDGLDDLVIGADGTGFDGLSSLGIGEAYVIFGTTSGFGVSLDVSSLNGSNGFAIIGVDTDDRAGSSVSAGGDINGDGVDDLIIGASGAGASDEGNAYVVFGKTTGFAASMELSSLNGSNGFMINGQNIGDGLGHPVNGGGDINGDGFADIILGVPDASPGGRTSAGSTYVILGSSSFGSSLDVSSLNGSNGFVLNGIDGGTVGEGDFSGISVSNTGDVNGDGLDDLIIGASTADPAELSYAGETYVVFGKTTAFAPSIELSSLNGTNGFTINGIEAGDLSGIAVSNGDFNGDGVDDMLIGAYGASPGGNAYAGESYVIFGKTTGFGTSFELSSLNGTNGFILNGVNPSDYSGYSLNAAGDINGDGIEDLIIGSFYASPNGDYSGQSYVVFGSNSGFGASIDLSSLDGTSGFIINGIDNYDYSGYSISAAGDLNGDGFDDLVIGAPFSGPGQAGEAYVVFGQVSGPDITSPVISTVTPSDNATFIATASNLVISFNENVQKGTGNILIKKNDDDSTIETIDVNSGLVTIVNKEVTINPGSDLPGEEDIYILIDNTAIQDMAGNDFAGIDDKTTWNFTTIGPDQFPPGFELSSLNGSNGFTIYGIDDSDELGISVSNAGDINGDGLDDLIIGASGTGWDGLSTLSIGEAYIIFGTTSGFGVSLDASSLNGSNGFAIIGVDTDDRAGSTVSAGGDINGDGVDDLIIGASGAGASDEGNAYVVFGKTTGFAASMELSSLNGSNGFMINGQNIGDGLGHPVNGGGDINGDGFADIILGVPDASPGGRTSAGSTYVILGSSSFGSSLDVSSLNGSNGFVLNGIDGGTVGEGDFSGISVSNTGDVNGDGLDDLIIGASTADPAELSYAGETYVVFGKTTAFAPSIELSSLNGTNGFTINGIEAGDLSGIAVSNGDFNGDGVDDMLIGAYGASPGGNAYAGESYVIFGKTTGFGTSFELSSLNGTNGFILNGVNPSDYSGYSLNAAGDINGDGLEDILIGASYASPNGSASGESYVVFGSSSGFASSIDLSSLDGTSGFILKGIDAYDYSGYSLSGAGDINGDGVDDIVIGAYNAGPGGNGAGESYVVFGISSGTDNSAPLVELFTPEDNTSGIEPGTNLLMDFNENVQKGSGNITIKKTSDDSDLEIIDVTSGMVAISNDVVTINPASDFPVPEDVYILIDNTAIKDMAGNNFAGISDKTIWNFATEDITPPTVVVQNITAVLDAGGQATITASQVNNGSTDNVTAQNNLVLALDITDFDCTDVGPNIVTLTVTDEADNSAEQTATVTVVDQNAPVVVTQDITIELNGSGAATIVPAEINNGSTDNCEISSLNLDKTTFDCNDVGSPQSVTLTVTDVNGNSNDATATVTVEDNTSPEALAQNIIVQLDYSGSASITAAQVDNGSNDACGIASLSLDQTSFGCADVASPPTVTLTVTDNHGNTSTANATVTVEEAIWYADTDGDGFGDPATTQASCTQPPDYVSNSDDCDDSNSSSTVATTWYQDADGDGFGNDASTTSACSAPTGYVADNTDCEDTNADLNPETVWYADTDGDEYGDPATSQVSCTQPTGFVANSLDCDPTSANVNPDGIDVAGSGIDANCDGNYLWFTDADGDGYAGTGTASSVNATPGTGEFASGDDCDDTNAAINSETTWYADSDGDGYGDSASSQASCTQPSGYVSNSDDCDDTNASITPQSTWYEDADGDGYGDAGSSQTACIQPTGTVSNATDCDDTDATVNPETVWYADTDGDGFGDTASTSVSCTQPSGFTLASGDCIDTNANVYPGAPALPDGLDNNCDGSIDKVAQTITIASIQDQLDNGGTVNVDANSSSGLPLSFDVTGPAVIDNNILTLQGAGSVTLTASQPGDDGYLAADQVSVTFCVNPVPEISIQSDNVAVLVIESNYTTGNQWSLNGSPLDGETNQSHLVTQTGEFLVEVTIDGCSGESGVFNAVLTGLNPASEISTTLFPNPVQYHLNIEVSNLDSRIESEAFIFDMNGSMLKRQLMIQQSYSKSVELDVSDLHSGPYILLIKTGEQVIRERFNKL